MWCAESMQMLKDGYDLFSNQRKHHRHQAIIDISIYEYRSVNKPASKAARQYPIIIQLRQHTFYYDYYY